MTPDPTEHSPLLNGDVKTKNKLYNGRGQLLPDSDDEEEELSSEEADVIADGNTSALSPSTSVHSIIKDRIRNSNRKASQSSAAARKKRSLPNPATSPQHPVGRPSTVVTALCYALLVVIILALIALGVVHFFVGRILVRFLNAPHGLEHFGKRSLIVQGPNHLHLDRIQDDSIHLTVTGNAGLDLWRGTDDWQESGWKGKIERRLVRWTVGKTREVQVQAGLKPIYLSSPATGESPLVSIASFPPFALPLRFEDDLAEEETQSKSSWLKELTLPLHIKVEDANLIAEFANKTWVQQSARVKVHVSEVSLTPGGAFWGLRKLTTFRVSGLQAGFQHKLPDLPFLEDPSSLVNLTSYSISSSTPKKHAEQQIYISGNATANNPLVSHRQDLPDKLRQIVDALGNATYSLPTPIPFDVFLLSNDSAHNTSQAEVKLARVDLDPFDFFLRQPNIPVSISGEIKPDSPTSPLLDPALSVMLSRYLDGRSTPVHIKPLASSALPSFLHPLLDSLPSIPLSIPGTPDPDTQLLQNVRIEHMRIDGAGPNNEILCSGTVMGELTLPPGLEGLNSILHITALWPDVLVFDGKTAKDAPASGEFPPRVIPAGAFARLRPDGWTKARSRIVEVPDIENGGRRNVTRIEMELEVVPMAILPGRGDVLRGFLAKLLFGSGSGPDGEVLTGVWGLSDARANLPALGDLSLKQVFVKGEFYVSKHDL